MGSSLRKRLKYLTSAMTASTTFAKSTYATRAHFFDEGDDNRSDYVVEALLVYWLSWYVLPSGPGDGLNQYVFPLSILLTKGEKLALSPLYLGSLYAQLCGQHDSLRGGVCRHPHRIVLPATVLVGALLCGGCKVPGGHHGGGSMARWAEEAETAEYLSASGLEVAWR